MKANCSRGIPDCRSRVVKVKFWGQLGTAMGLPLINPSTWKSSWIFVTHDKEEAMAVSDRIAILNCGRLEQVGAPFEIYYRPESRFAAEFMGSSNILEMDVMGYDETQSRITAEIAGRSFSFRGERPAGTRVILSVRLEWLRVVMEPRGGEQNLLSGTVLSSTFLGSMIRYHVSGRDLASSL